MKKVVCTGWDIHDKGLLLAIVYGILTKNWDILFLIKLSKKKNHNFFHSYWTYVGFTHQKKKGCKQLRLGAYTPGKKGDN